MDTMGKTLLVRILKAIANPIRMDIILELRSANQTVSDLVLATGHEQSHVSHNLKDLLLQNIVSATREGQNTRYSLNEETVLPIIDLSIRHGNSYHFRSTTRHAHKADCMACKNIPELTIKAASTSHLLNKHTCNCKACMKNTTAIARKKPLSTLDQNHPCACIACAENQYLTLKYLNSKETDSPAYL